MDNTILWNNAAVSTGPQVALIAHFYFDTALTAEACALEGGPADVYVENTTCNFSWGNIITTDPELADPGTWVDNGTPGDLFDDTWHPGDYHLTAASSCIDTGNDTAVHLPALDFDGHSRIMDGDGDGALQVDIGADEYGQTTPCESDRDIDGDVDGFDLAMLAGDPSVMDLSIFAMKFGQMRCGP